MLEEVLDISGGAAPSWFRSNHLLNLLLRSAQAEPAASRPPPPCSLSAGKLVRSL